MLSGLQRQIGSAQSHQGAFGGYTLVFAWRLVEETKSQAGAGKILAVETAPQCHYLEEVCFDR